MNLDKIDLVDVSTLAPHPRNNEFFDDISGEMWEDFLRSVKQRGVIEPIIITNNGLIVSGHQRVRACRELGVEKIPAIVRIYDGEQELVRDLIETNIRQRGLVRGSYKQQLAIIQALEGVYGVDSSVGRPASGAVTATDIAEKVGVSRAQYNRIKRIADLIPEMQEAADEEKFPLLLIQEIARNLSKEEQEEVLTNIGGEKVEEAVRRALESQQERVQREFLAISQERDGALIAAKQAEARLQEMPNEYEQLANLYDNLFTAHQAAVNELSRLKAEAPVPNQFSDIFAPLGKLRDFCSSSQKAGESIKKDRQTREAVLKTALEANAELEKFIEFIQNEEE